MKKYIIIALCIINPLNAMELPIDPSNDIKKSLIMEREPREWLAEAYDAGNTSQTKAFLQFLETNKITTEKKTILSLGCGTGRIENELAEKAISIHGFDASKNMIDFAKKKYGQRNNLSFEHCFAEDFKSYKKYDLAFASFSMHWFEDKKQALQNINQSLKENGEFFVAVSTSNNPKPFNLIAAENIINKFFFWLGWFGIDLTGCSLSSNQELTAILNETDFDIIRFEEQSFDDIISENELRECLWPIVSSRPIMQYIPDSLTQKFFDYYVDECISQLSKTDDNKLMYKIFTTIIHARKK